MNQSWSADFGPKNEAFPILGIARILQKPKTVTFTALNACYLVKSKKNPKNIFRKKS